MRSAPLNKPTDDSPRKDALTRLIALGAADQAESEPLGDDLATLETRSLTSGKSRRQLEVEAEEAEHDRTQRFRWHFEWLAIGAMWIFAFTLLAIGLTWLLHLLAPQWGWLSPDDLARVQNIFTGGILAGVVADHFRKRLA